MIKLSFCYNDPPMGESFSKNNSLVVYTFWTMSIMIFCPVYFLCGHNLSKKPLNFMYVEKTLCTSSENILTLSPSMQLSAIFELLKQVKEKKICEIPPLCAKNAYILGFVHKLRWQVLGLFNHLTKCHGLKMIMEIHYYYI